MAYIKLSNGSVKSVDDDELRDLIGAGAGVETDAPNRQPQSTQDTTPGYAYDSPEDFEDLYANAKAVGYSGLDQAQKDLFNQSYSKSIYARNGKTLKQAQDETDARADNAGLSLRSITGLVPATSSGLAGGIRAAYDDTTGNKLGAAWEGAKEAAGTSYNNAKAGRDISGFVADPTNYLMLVPGAGELNLFDKVPALAEKIPAIVKATKIPEVVGEVAGKALTKIGQLPGYIGSALTQGLSGAGATAASEALDPSEKVTPLSVAIAGGIGGATGLASKGLSNFGYNIYPNQTLITNSQKDRYLTPDQLEAHMSNVPFPYTMSNQQKAAEGWLEEAGNKFDEAIKVIPDERTYSDINPELAQSWIPDIRRLENAGYSNDEARYYATSDILSPRTIYPEVEKNRTNQFLKEKRGLDLQSNAPRKTLENQVDNATKKRLNDLGQKMDAQKRLTGDYPDVGIPQPLEINQNMAPRIDIKDFSKLRGVYTSQYTPNAKAKERAANYADELMHDAIVHRMELIPEYKKEIEQPLSSGFGAKKQYAVGSRLADFIYNEPPNPRGIPRRFSVLFNNYAVPTAMFKAGHTAYPSIGSNALFRGISQYLQDNDQSDR